MQIRNRVTLIGRLGTPPQQKLLTSETTYTRFRLATNEHFRDRKGERQRRTTWHTVVAYGKLAERLQQTVDKGDQIAVEGTIRYREWKDKYEQTRTIVEIVAREFTYLTSKRVASVEKPVAPAHPSISIPTPAPAPRRPRSQEPADLLYEQEQALALAAEEAEAYRQSIA